MKVIPAIDIIDGKCVRLVKGDYGQKTEYPEDPLSVAQKIENEGLTHLHLVDLDGARAGRVINIDVLKELVSCTNLEIDFGGGVRSRQDLELVLNAGAQMVTGGSIAVRDRQEFEGWLRDYPGRIILGADVKDGKVAVSAWRESSDIGLSEFVRHYSELGVRRIVCTEVERDGMMSGPAEHLYTTMISEYPEGEWIASGGIRDANDLRRMSEIGMWGAIVGKAFHDGKLGLDEMKECEN